MLNGLMMNTPLMISSILQHAQRCYPNQQIVSFHADGEVRRHSIAQFDTRCRKLAQWLLDLGVQQGDRVATLAWNDHQHLELYFAISSLGAVCHTVNPRLEPDEIAYILNHAEDRLVFFDPQFAPIIKQIRAQVDAVTAWISLGYDAPEQGFLAYEPSLAACAPIAEWPILDENAASGLCYTSGTTGRPKGVLYSHRSTVLHAMVCSQAAVFGTKESDAILPVVPMFHVNAWGIPYVALMTGAKLVLPGPRLDGASLTNMFNSEGVTISAGVPTIWQGLMEYLKSSGEQLETMREIMVGGAAMPAGLAEYFEQLHGMTAIQGWGMTETSPICTVGRLRPDMEDLPRDARTQVQIKQGRPVFGIDLKIDAQLGVDEEAEQGELLARGPWICSDYYKNDAEPVLRDGWFPSGDIAKIDQDAFLLLTDRVKDVIKSGGEWISSIEIEDVALKHQDVLRAAVIGVPDEKWSERPILIVVLDEGVNNTEELKEHLHASLPKWRRPDRIEVIDVMPLGATGKVLKTELRKRFPA